MFRFFCVAGCHLLFVLAVLDIFFQSTVYPNLRSVQSDVGKSDILPYPEELFSNIDSVIFPQRLILFVCDGLPAEYLYFLNEEGFSYAPFIRYLITAEGSWGLSFTRVPTESRPGHIALIAGLYEDPSAIFKGWQDNPVTFDSLFNQSHSAFGFGCEDILDIFEKRTNRMKSFKYPSNWQDYSGSPGSAEKLDSWVQDQFNNMISQAKEDSLLNNTLHKPKTIIFFHLLGMDVAGHAYKPKSKFYLDALNNMDHIIHGLVTSVNDFYKDKKTSFVLTSDHGMTDWGSHGAGSSIETVTPFVVWGAGIKKPTILTPNQDIESVHGVGKLNGDNNISSARWGLDKYLRHDLNQADLTVLMATLLDVPIPVNSLGVLPKSVLDLPTETIIVAYYTNCLQLLQLFEAKENSTKENFASFLFNEYEQFPYSVRSEMLSEIRSKIVFHDFHNAELLINKLISIILQGIEYYDAYFKSYYVCHLLLGFFSVTMVIIGQILDNWPIRLLLKARLINSPLKYSFRSAMKICCYVSGAIGFSSYFFGVFSTRYLVYFIISDALVFWSIQDNHYYFSLYKLFLNRSFLLHLGVYFIFIQSMVFSFMNREYLACGLICLAFWPYKNVYMEYVSAIDKYIWSFLCVLLATFLFIPIVQEKEDLVIKVLAAVSYLFLHWCFSPKRLENRSLSEQIYTYFPYVSAVVLIANMIGIHVYLETGTGYLTLYQTISFLLLFLFLGNLKFGSNDVKSRFLRISFAVTMSFLQFSLSYEGFFPIILALLLLQWICFEKSVTRSRKERLFRFAHNHSLGDITPQDIRRCAFYLFFIFLSFFGVGNLSSINSFNTDWLKGFLTSFNPFCMMALIILRTVLPFLLVTFAFKHIINSLHVESETMFYIVLLFCESIAAELLLTVQNTGSWLEIGTSLTRFIIVEFIVFFLFILYLIVEGLTLKSTIDYDNEENWNELRPNVNVEIIDVDLENLFENWAPERNRFNLPLRSSDESRTF